MSGKIEVKGARELERALRQTDKESLKALRRELRLAGKVVAMDARARLSARDGRSAMGIRPRTRSGLTVTAEQSRSRVTGKRPDWGALVMREALVPALWKNRVEVERQVADAIERVAKGNGF